MKTWSLNHLKLLTSDIKKHLFLAILKVKILLLVSKFYIRKWQTYSSFLSILNYSFQDSEWLQIIKQHTLIIHWWKEQKQQFHWFLLTKVSHSWFFLFFSMVFKFILISSMFLFQCMLIAICKKLLCLWQFFKTLIGIEWNLMIFARPLHRLFE